MRQNIDLSNLTLSLDAGSAIPIYEEQQMVEVDGGDYRLDAYKMIINPLRELREVGLKRFYVYWGCYHSFEAEAEKEVMGEDYEAEGKIAASKREPSDPHGDLQKDQELRSKYETPRSTWTKNHTSHHPPHIIPSHHTSLANEKQDTKCTQIPRYLPARNHIVRVELRKRPTYVVKKGGCRFWVLPIELIRINGLYTE